MNLEQFRKKRVTRHQKKMSRYLTYVFNDHFVLVLLFAVGGVGYAYSEFLKQQSHIPNYLLIGACITLSLSLVAGKLATLIEPADEVFLTPLETEMPAYLNKMKKRSAAVPFALLFLLVFALMPLFVAGSSMKFKDVYFLVPTVWLFKAAELDTQQILLFSSADSNRKSRKQKWNLALFGLSLIAFSVSVFFFPWMGPVIGMVVWIGIKQVLNAKSGSNTLDWEKMIRGEQERQFTLYRLINLFTDVPVIKSSVKQKKWLDKSMNRLYKSKQNPFDELFPKVFTRNAAYRGLYFRLLFIGLLLQVLSPFRWLNYLFAVLFLYLIAFQLVPLYNHFEGNVFAHLYPVTQQKKIASLKKLLGLLLGSAGLVFTGGAIISVGWFSAILLLGMEVAFCVFFLQVALPGRIKKANT